MFAPPAQCQENQRIDRGIFEEVDRVGNERYRSDGNCDAELDAKIGKIERCDPQDGRAKSVGWPVGERLLPTKRIETFRTLFGAEIVVICRFH